MMHVFERGEENPICRRTRREVSVDSALLDVSRRVNVGRHAMPLVTRHDWPQTEMP